MSRLALCSWNLIFVLALLMCAWVGHCKRVDHAGATELAHGAEADDEICVGCASYPEAPDYDDDWTKENGIMKTVEHLKELEEAGKSLEDLSPEEQADVMQLQWNILMHGIFKILQGQKCNDLCVLCAPTQESFVNGEDLVLKTVAIIRSKNWQDTAAWPVLGTVDGALGGVVGGVAGLGLGLAAMLGGGGATGVAAGGATSGATAPHIGSLAGGLLGLVAGVSAAATSGVLLFTGVELASILGGIYKGVGIVSSLTDCKRVGFEQTTDGKADEELFKSIGVSSEYGLKKLRKWMADNAPVEKAGAEAIVPYGDAAPASIVQPGDQEAVKHCERVREHSFDMRHAVECVKHSQLCGGPGFVVPLVSPSECRKISSIEYLEQLALKYGDDPETGLFAQWRKFQEHIKEKVGLDLQRKAKCVQMLCEFKGFKRAALKLHPDRLTRMEDGPEKEKLIMDFTFLSSCKDDFKSSDGVEFTLNSKEERDVVCADVADA